MNVRTKALSATVITVVAVLVAWLGATHTNAQNALTRPPAVETSPPPTATDVDAVAAAPVDAAPGPAEALAEAADEPAENVEPVDLPPIQAEGGVIMHWPLQNAPIRQALRQLAMWSQRNIVASKNVDGVITMDLFNVTFREALDSLVRMNELAYVEEGNFIYVYTAEELADLEQTARPRVTEVFHLDYVKPEDVVELIKPLLSEDGKVATTPQAAGGIPPDKTTAGGMDYAATDVIVVTDYPENIDAITETVRQTDVRPVQVMIEATIMTASLDEENHLGIDFATLDGIDFLGSSASGAGTFFSGGVGDAVADTITGGSGGLEFAWFGSDVGVFIEALESTSDINVLSNPKLLVVNKQRGEIIVGNEIGYLNSTTELQTGSVTQSVAFLEDGTRLIVRPYVGADGYIRLEIHPELSVGSVKESGGFSLPEKQTTECTSNIMVRDGHTVVISGMFREKTQQDRHQVPVLGNIPILGAAFRRTDDVLEREEVIILVTPRVIHQAADEAASLQLRDDMTRFRIGMRQNLMWYGRNRLAASHLNWAKEHMANGKTAWALWDINMALSLSPAHDEAIRLKEHLTGEAIWADEPRRDLTDWVVETMILNEMGYNVNILKSPHRPADLMDLPEDVRDALGVGPDYTAPILPEPVERPEAIETEGDEAVPVEPVESAAEGEDPAAAEEASADEPMAQAVEDGVG